MNISIVITTYGTKNWAELAWSRAYPSTIDQGAHEVIVHHEPDLPIGPARNAAATKATGGWLVFLDADDELQPGYIEAMERATRTQSYLSLFQPAVSYVRNGKPKPPVLIPAKSLRDDNFLIVGTMIARGVFDDVGGFSDYPHGFEDWSLWAKAWKAGCSVVQVPDAVYVAHVNPRSAHKTMWRNRRQQVATHLLVQAELFPEGT